MYAVIYISKVYSIGYNIVDANLYATSCVTKGGIGTETADNRGLALIE